MLRCQMAPRHFDNYEMFFGNVSSSSRRPTEHKNKIVIETSPVQLIIKKIELLANTGIVYNELVASNDVPTISPI